jgi:CelD/BcsL family acetyltransferase involved in cellulose biosynthesis
MEVVPFTAGHAEAWDALVERAPMATFLHSRLFLSYHGERFRDASVVLLGDDGELRAALPAALDPDDERRVVSHPGATYGGLVHDGSLTGERARDALAAIRAHYAAEGRSALRYKPVPHVYHRSPSADDVWALGALGATRCACDLSCAIALGARREPSSRRRRSRARAERSGVTLSGEPSALAAFWPVLDATLERRHGARAVHTIEEIEELRSRFPRQIRPLVALLGDEVVAGTVLFVSHTTVHTQYLAASERGMETSALDAVVEGAIELARAAGAAFFDFGVSVGPDRRGLVESLYRWKAEFGGGGVLYEHYESTLS